jgi:non-homologous end joining protein Ku
MRLSGMFNFANSDPNDEQRAQYMTRTMNDYSGQLSGLLKKLAAAESQDISGAESNYQNALAQIAQAKAAAQAKVQQSLRAAQQQQFNNMAKMYSLLQKNRGQAKTAASNSPYPVSRGYDQEGNPLYIDGNRYSPTYGQQIYWQE